MEKPEQYGVSPIAEMTDGIILAKFEKNRTREKSYQTESQLEESFIADLVMQGYERLNISTSEELLLNLRVQMERLNSVKFTDSEWARLLREYINTESDGPIEKTRKIQEDSSYAFRFDDGRLGTEDGKNIILIDKKDISRNVLQVVNQVKQEGTHKNRYDVTILVNGLPLVHIELKKRGNSLQEAFYQIHKYTKESFNIPQSLYKFVQIFVISNGTHTRYFANTTKREKGSYQFTIEWADAQNNVIRDLEDFTATFFAKRTLLEILTKYCVFDVNNTLLIMRPYQIAAAERIISRINFGHLNKLAGKKESGGYIWHTTGSGKTLTSFKTARLATTLEYVDKVFFVVDRKDLDAQTMKEYERFQSGSVAGTANTRQLKEIIESTNNDEKIIVTTIQKLNEFVKKNPGHEVFKKNCVLIFDECHRSQFGEAQKNIRSKFKKYYMYGFTGTPIFVENALGVETTQGVFGNQLHSYVITDAIRDENVLKFKVDYRNVAPKYKEEEILEYDEKDLEKLRKKALLHPDRIKKIVEHILKVYGEKTHRNEVYEHKNKSIKGFNAMFAVQSVEAAKMYYNEFKKQQKELPEEKRLKIATIFSFAPNEEQEAVGEIVEEKMETDGLDKSSKEFLDGAIKEYNKNFGTNYSTESKSFELYYKDLSMRVKEKQVDLLIVVGMFLTGFDAPTLNTLFVDANFRYHGLIQAFSRTNRKFNKVKAFGNIVCFRDLQKATEEAIATFGDKNSVNIILEKSYEQYLEGFIIEETGEAVRGFKQICKELNEVYENIDSIQTEKEKAEFVKLFNEYLRRENILKNFDEYRSQEPLIDERKVQDLTSTYIEIKESITREKIYEENSTENIDLSDIEFEVELLAEKEINLDYILEIILKKTQEHDSKEELESDVRRLIKSSLGTRAKEDLIIEYIQTHNLKLLKNLPEILEDFNKYAVAKREKEIKKIIEEENLRPDLADRYIRESIEKGEANEFGEDVDGMIQKVSRIGGKRAEKKKGVLSKIRKIVEVFVGI